MLDDVDDDTASASIHLRGAIQIATIARANDNDAEREREREKERKRINDCFVIVQCVKLDSTALLVLLWTRKL